MNWRTLPRIYLDLDGVLADFDGAFPKFFGFDHRIAGDEAMWEAINNYGTYFRDLPPCPGALEFYDRISPLNPMVLTACPPERYADVASQKRAWVREHLGPRPLVLPVQGSKAKPLFMHAPGDILIDDFPANIARWEKAGGRGILHTGDFAATREKLLEYLR